MVSLELITQEIGHKMGVGEAPKEISRAVIVWNPSLKTVILGGVLKF